MPTPLPIITTLARSGALDRAWELFRAGGYEAANGDPGALAVKGRLLKDRAFLEKPSARRAELLAEAAAAYEAADALAPAPYLLINAAACRSLAGDALRAKADADAVLVQIASGAASETPYWLAATRAEAFLIRGEPVAAAIALGEAMRADPDGWDDHASTLRQFARLIAALGGDDGWLEAHRPPASLHFAGHLGLAPEACAGLRAQVDALLENESVGFGYGALAAGADIVIAEALLAHGAELHLVLPLPVADFLALSVTPFGKAWRARFDACLAAAASLHVAASTGRETFEPLATALAAELAMGAAMLNARRLESRAVQLLVIDEGDGPFGGGEATARDGMVWAKTGAAQHVLVAPRSAPVAASSTRSDGRSDRRLAALVQIGFDGLERLDDGTFANALDHDLAPFCARVAANATLAFHSEGGPAGALYAFADCTAARDFALAVLASDPTDKFPLRLACTYGLVLVAGPALTGPLVRRLAEMGEYAVPGTATLSHSFATALQLADANARPQLLGDFTLSPDERDAPLFTLTT